MRPYIYVFGRHRSPDGREIKDVAMIFRSSDGMQIGNAVDGIAYWGDVFPFNNCAAFIDHQHATDFLMVKACETTDREQFEYRDMNSKIIGADGVASGLRAKIALTQ